MRAFIIENEKITNIIEVEKLSDVSGAVADDGGYLGWDYKSINILIILNNINNIIIL